MAELQASTSLADTGIAIANIVAKVANVALKIDQGIEGVDRVLGPFAAFIPYYSQAMAVVKIADPIIAKIAAAAPIVGNAIEAGRPVIEAAQAQAPEVIAHVKEVLSIALDRPLGTVGDEALLAGFGAALLDGTPLKSVWEASLFTPQDQRFDRQTPQY
jgi:hypothetical protein